jgi:hypothetical protein
MLRFCETITVVGLLVIALWTTIFGAQVGHRHYELVCLGAQCGVVTHLPREARARADRRISRESCLQLPLNTRWTDCEQGVAATTRFAFAR